MPTPPPSPAAGPGGRSSAVAAGAGLLLLAVGLGLAQSASDRQVFGLINAWGAALPLTASALSVLGLGASMFLLAAAVGLRQPVVPAALLLVIVGGGLEVQLLKSLLALPRPAAVLDPQHLVVVGQALKGRAMPSGHAALFAATATLLWLVPRSAGPRRWRWGVAAAMSMLALAGALSRVVVGAHWPSDLLAGAGLGLLTATLVAGTSRGVETVQRVAAALSGRTGSRVMVALVTATAASLWVAERDLPLAQAWYAGLSLLGLLAAVGWWRLHPDPLTRVLWRRLSLRP